MKRRKTKGERQKTKGEKRKAGALALCFVLSSFVLSSFVLTQNQVPSFRTSTDVVELNVSVTDGRKVIANLTAADFKVLDNDVEQTVISVSRETLPIDVTILLDTSESLSVPMLETLVNAAKRIRSRLRPDDRVSIVTFNHRIQERVALSVPGVISQISLGRPAGQTSLNDAIAVVLSQLPAVERRQMMIVFTDGRDSTSILNASDVIRTAGRSNTAVFAISRSGGNVAGLLLELAATTGGEAQLLPLFGVTLSENRGPAPPFRSTNVTPTQNTTLLDEPFLKAFDDFRSSYVLRYNLTGVPRQGWHTVTVTVPKGKKYTVRTRSGYAG